MGRGRAALKVAGLLLLLAVVGVAAQEPPTGPISPAAEAAVERCLAETTSAGERVGLLELRSVVWGGEKREVGYTLCCSSDRSPDFELANPPSHHCLEEWGSSLQQSATADFGAMANFAHHNLPAAGNACTLESDTLSLQFPRDSTELPTADQRSKAISEMKSAGQPSKSCCEGLKPYIDLRCPCDVNYQQLLPIGGYNKNYFIGLQPARQVVVAWPRLSQTDGSLALTPLQVPRASWLTRARSTSSAPEVVTNCWPGVMCYPSCIMVSSLGIGSIPPLWRPLLSAFFAFPASYPSSPSRQWRKRLIPSQGKSSS